MTQQKAWPTIFFSVCKLRESQNFSRTYDGMASLLLDMGLWNIEYGLWIMDYGMVWYVWLGMSGYQ